MIRWCAGRRTAPARWPSRRVPARVRRPAMIRCCAGRRTGLTRPPSLPAPAQARLPARIRCCAGQLRTAPVRRPSRLVPAQARRPSLPVTVARIRVPAGQLRTVRELPTAVPCRRATTRCGESPGRTARWRTGLPGSLVAPAGQGRAVRCPPGQVRTGRPLLAARAGTARAPATLGRPPRDPAAPALHQPGRNRQATAGQARAVAGSVNTPAGPLRTAAGPPAQARSDRPTAALAGTAARHRTAGQGCAARPSRAAPAARAQEPDRLALVLVLATAPSRVVPGQVRQTRTPAGRPDTRTVQDLARRARLASLTVRTGPKGRPATARRPEVRRPEVRRTGPGQVADLGSPRTRPGADRAAAALKRLVNPPGGRAPAGGDADRSAAAWGGQRRAWRPPDVPTGGWRGRRRVVPAFAAASADPAWVGPAWVGPAAAA
jgi:hypothetical protein